MNRIPIVLSIALLCGCGKSVETQQAWQGYVEGEYVYVASPFGGQLDTLAVKRGSLVKKGDLLFKLDSREETAQLASAKSLLAQAQATLDDIRKGKRPEEIAALEEISHQAKAAKELSDIEFARESTLLKANATRVKDYDAANYAQMEGAARLAETSANLAVAKLGSREDQIRAWESYCEALKANCSELEWKLAQKSQAAPCSGRVFDTFYREGEYAAASKSVVALLPPEGVRIRFFIGERQLSSLHPGDTMRYRLDGQDFKNAVINYISPEVEYTPPVIYSRESRAKLVYMVEAMPLPSDAATLNVGAPLDVMQGAGK